MAIRFVTRSGILRILALFIVLGATPVVHAARPALVFSSIDYPGALATRAFGISAIGAIVGNYNDASGRLHGFLLSEGTFTTIDVPGATATQAWGINPSGDIVGYYTAGGRTIGFLLRDGIFADIDSGHRHTLAIKISPAGDVVGCFHDSNFLMDMFGYVFRDGVFTDTFELMSSMHNGITPNGKTVVGLNFEMSGKIHGYLIDRGTFTALDFPGAASTGAWDLNPAGTIVGLYLDASNRMHSFLWDANGPSDLQVPGAISSSARGINPRGDIVGVYTDAANRTHGYLLSREE